MQQFEHLSDRLDRAARHVLEAARSEAASSGGGCIGTEELLMALATADPVTGRLLAEAGGSAPDLRRATAATCLVPLDRYRHPDQLLETLGVDLAEVRLRAEQTFGADAVARAASGIRPRRPRRPLRSWFSCSKPLPSRTCDSPLTGPRIDPIPRVDRILKRATRSARPGLVSPAHLLLMLLAGNEPACEILVALGVDLEALATATRRALNDGDAAGERAS